MAVITESPVDAQIGEPAELIGAQPVIQARSQVDAVVGVYHRIVGRDDVGEDGRRDHDDDDQSAGSTQRLAADQVEADR